jgi:CHAT domain-containing protein
VLLGAEASERAVKQVQRPAVLHLITHGTFLKDQEAGQQLENPLLRSWLILAGANQRKNGNDDGILTAYEAAALDLWGTKLVVLSACETGVGEIRNGEGVYGLRRALVLAGAETQVMSLWKADDLVTRKLMEKYYGRLKAGGGRAEALRQAQLELLRGKANQHPYYWANFICIGEWKPLDKW